MKTNQQPQLPFIGQHVFAMAKHTSSLHRTQWDHPARHRLTPSPCSLVQSPRQSFPATHDGIIPKADAYTYPAPVAHELQTRPSFTFRTPHRHHFIFRRHSAPCVFNLHLRAQLFPPFHLSFHPFTLFPPFHRMPRHALLPTIRPSCPVSPSCSPLTAPPRCPCICLASEHLAKPQACASDSKLRF